MKALIQSEGFTVSATCRTYKFQVLEAPLEPRKFSIEIVLESFHDTALKFQDGPLLTRERLEGELVKETGEMPAENHMKISDLDIVQYMERHYPAKLRKWSPPIKAKVRMLG